MNNDCVDFELIPEITELPPDDPRRRHVEACARCGSFLASYRSFVQEEDVEGSDTEDARARIRRFLTSLTEAPGEAVEDPARAIARGGEGLWRRVAAVFYPRPVWAAAVLVIVAASVLWWHPWTPDTVVLRGKSPEAVTQPLTLGSPQKQPDGGVRLDWTPMGGADGYQVILYDRDFNAIARLEPTDQTSLVIDRSSIPAGAPTELIWRVLAHQRGDEIGASDPASLKLD